MSMPLFNALLDVCYSDLYFNRAIEVIHNDVGYRKEREADRSRDMELQAENQALSNHFYFAYFVSVKVLIRDCSGNILSCLYPLRIRSVHVNSFFNREGSYLLRIYH